MQKLKIEVAFRALLEKLKLLTNLRQKIAYSKMHKKQKAMFALAMQG